jgi:hypothetical protein
MLRATPVLARENGNLLRKDFYRAASRELRFSLWSGKATSFFEHERGRLCVRAVIHPRAKTGCYDLTTNGKRPVPTYARDFLAATQARPFAHWNFANLRAALRRRDLRLDCPSESHLPGRDPFEQIAID